MSSIKEQIAADLKQALKNNEKIKVSSLRLLKNAINQASIEQGKNEELGEEKVIEILQSEAKKRKEAIQQYKKASREELAEKEKKELRAIQNYLPEPLSEEKLESIIKKVIEEINAQNMQDMGKVMGKVMPKVKGKADGSKVKKLVKQKLQ